jgi:hypothetical protein
MRDNDNPCAMDRFAGSFNSLHARCKIVKERRVDSLHA